MNIFYLSHKPSRCARWHCDKHVVKMILETAQLLYTAHWATGQMNFDTAPFRKGTAERGYKSIRNKNHPSAIWTRESIEHYTWLCQLGEFLCAEYTYRYSKEHSCQKHIYWLAANPPGLGTGWRQPPQAMPEEYKKSNSVAAYRAYYLGAKSAFLSYKRRARPHWIPKI